MHVQQKTWPHVVTLGSFIGSRHSVHFLCCCGCNHPRTDGSERSYRGTEDDSKGVCVATAIRDLPSAALTATGNVWFSSADACDPNPTSTPSSNTALALSVGKSVVTVLCTCNHPCITICNTNSTPRTSYPTLSSGGLSRFENIYLSPEIRLLIW